MYAFLASFRSAVAQFLASDLCTRKRYVLPFLLVVGAVSILVDIGTGPYVNFTAGHFLVVAVGAYCLGAMWGVAIAGAMLLAQLGVYLAVWPQPFPALFVATALVNRGIIYLFAILMLAAIKDAHRLREENLRLRTLRQTMVTVNDIVLNRLQLIAAMVDLCEEGRPLTAANFAAARRVLKEVTQKLRRLGSQETAASYRAAGDIEAIVLEDPAAGDDGSSQSPSSANTQR